MNYINYFTKFLDAANIKKLKDIAQKPSNEESAEHFKGKGKFKGGDINDKFAIFYKVLSINNNFLSINNDN